jgi:hypothetical protein
MVTEQHYRSVERCDVCGDCARALAPDEPVRIGFTTATGTRRQHPVCDRCWPRYAASSMQSYWYRPQPCEWCERTVARLVPSSAVPQLVPGYWRPGTEGGIVNVASGHRRTFCSDSCRQREASSRRAQARLRARQRACDGCGVTFVGTRADAHYCSSACRQRAYRLRRKPPPPVDVAMLDAVDDLLRP